MGGLARRQSRSRVSDRQVLLLAVATALGAAWARPVQVAVVVVLLLAAVAARRPLLFVLAAGAAASLLGQRALDGAAATAARPVAGVAVLVGDPEPVGGALRVVVRFEGHRYEAWATGS